MGKERKSGLSESFVVGVIALVFMIVGYQTALFIHNAAVIRIAANRDSPDTVYVYESPAEIHSLQQGSSSSHSTAQLVRKDSYHSPVASSVRKNVPVKNVESFVFDPNTVTVEQLCRLGFTLKQAESIDKYRLRGGRFRRKEDFRKSYVVSDSVYRRLEQYIHIPQVDLNLADSSDFDTLPGIGGWFAAKMVAHREALGGYSYKEQLMDIYRFDQEKFDALSDLVTVASDHITPYPLWELPAESLKSHPYIANIETARAIVLFRENHPRQQWTVEALENSGIIDAETAGKLSRCIIK